MRCGGSGTRAREDPFYFADNRQRYKAPDIEQFWDADETVAHMLAGLGVELQADAVNPKLSNVHWMRGDGRTLAGVEDASVDACVSVVTLQHVPD